MRRVKRAAIIVKPKQSYLDWANSLDEDGVQIGDDFMPEHTFYLVEDVIDVELDVEAIMAPHSDSFRNLPNQISCSNMRREKTV